jgi:small neutral amino acid transporter SnatA (MarC family)
MGAGPTSEIPTVIDDANDQSTVLRHDTRARFIIGLFIILQFVVLIGFVIVKGQNLPDSQLIIGAEIGFVSIVLNYFFGSSSGSVTKSASKDGQNGEPNPTARS